MPFPCDGLMLCCVSLHWCFSINLLVVLSLISIYLFFIVDSLALALNSFKQIWFTHIWSQEVIYVITIALILWQLGYGLRTLNTLSQVTGYPNYRVNIHPFLPIFIETTLFYTVQSFGLNSHFMQEIITLTHAIRRGVYKFHLYLPLVLPSVWTFTGLVPTFSFIFLLLRFKVQPLFLFFESLVQNLMQVNLKSSWLCPIGTLEWGWFIIC